jgi:hypothetical protein
MSTGNGATDAELKQWLGEVCPVVARALKLPQPMEKAANQVLETVSVGTTLRWVEMLGIGRADKIRLMAQNAPDAVAKLSSPEGQQAVRSWEATHRVIPVLRALKGTVKTIRAFWRAGGYPRRAVIRALAAISASQVVPDAVGFREELSGVIGRCQSDTVRLIEGYAVTAVADEVEKIESIDRVISRSLPFGPWVRSLWVCLKLRVQGIKRSSETDPEWGHPLWRLSLTLREVAGRKGKETLGQ